MARDDYTRAPNAQLTQAVVYGPDPRGHQMFADLTGALTRGLTGQRAVVAGPTFGGYAQAPQRFRGAAQLGASRPVTPRASEMSDQISTVAYPLTAAFAARESRS